MTQTIDPIKLKAAAEHLEWVLKQYPDNDDVRGLYDALSPLTEDAKAGNVLEPFERIPCEYNFADGVYEAYTNPDVGEAYAIFSTEMEGGLSEQGQELRARIEVKRSSRLQLSKAKAIATRLAMS
jgi:hypothetical protein